MKKKFLFVFLCINGVCALFLNSCIGLSVDIQMNRNGSGKLVMEYRISNTLSNMGSLDGNASMPAIPLSRQDLERTVERIPGLKLSSYSKRETLQDNIININLDFSNVQALLAYLDPNGSAASISHNDQSGNFNIIIYNENNANHDENLIALMRSLYNDYNFSISFSAGGNSAMTITDGNGNTIPSMPSASVISSGRKVSFSMGIPDILEIKNGLGFKINW
ncbi:MAG: hypothetical protein FWB86_04295 [Treponema sp.]|nr:hypothetical protein [Treponema sp.]MCL2250308.1 hypothetical protein [Treponema sp.]